MKEIQRILVKAQLTENERLAMAALCDGPCSPTALAERLGLAHFIVANRFLGRAGHKVFDTAPLGSKIRTWHPEGWGNRGWYHVIAPGLPMPEGSQFYWVIRPAVRKAFVALGWYALLGKTKRSQPNSNFEPRFEGAEVMRFVSVKERDPQLRAACIGIHGYR